MKKHIFLFVSFLALLSCSKDEFSNNNPYLPNYTFSVTVNMALPQYNNLLYPGNAVYIFSGSEGVRGVFVFNTGSGYVAFDAACPNQELSSCSTMELDGIKAVCPCDDAEYSLFTGQAEGKEYSMKQYRVQIIDNQRIKVYN